MANAIRMLAVDAVEQAKSGHPGAPMGMADIAEVLWHRHLRHNPANPHWADRDRFVLSNGHGSMLIYALLHLTGYDLPMSELKNFRQLHSKTAGHPEVGITPGVETTTGPLGQGITNAVGMALAEKLMAAEFNRPGHTIVDHHTYVFLGDGCLMEGISHEACSLAGTLRLNKLIAFYDDNGISIDGHVEGWFTDDTPRRFEAYGWHVIPRVDGHDPSAIEAALVAAKSQALRPDGKPTLICCQTVIGKGSPHKAGTHDVHGAALGAAEVQATREALGWTHPPFELPQDVARAWHAVDRGQAMEDEWQRRFALYRASHPALADAFEQRMQGALPAMWAQQLPALLAGLAAHDNVATRKASQLALDAMAPLLPALFGGSADLTSSNLTNFKGCERAGRDPTGHFRWGNHLSYGVREFGMAAIMNGLALHGGYIPYGGTFLTFSDYSRNAIRMAALMKQRVIHVFTHDSIGLGEDGPTHQSVEHIPSLRLIPQLDVWRPADALETAVAWAHAIERSDGPSALCLSRQNLPRLSDVSRVDAVRRGGYVLADVETSQAVIIGTGSELQLALRAHEALLAQGIATRVVSMPSTSVFDRQDRAWQDSVLPPHLPAVAVEAAQPDLWRKYVGRTGAVVGMPGYGESAPAAVLYPHFGITAERVAQAVREVLA
ncbi:MAG: transketolase [Hydrogenophaga sp.]|nr:transketolase [Hydrogenophaga sp.]